MSSNVKLSWILLIVTFILVSMLSNIIIWLIVWVITFIIWRTSIEYLDKLDDKYFLSMEESYQQVIRAIESQLVTKKKESSRQETNNNQEVE